MKIREIYSWFVAPLINFEVYISTAWICFTELCAWCAV